MSSSDIAPKSLNDITGCLADYDPNALPVQMTQSIIEQFVDPVKAIEKVAIRSSLDRILATDIISPFNVPSHDNSAMDGYAVRHDDVANGNADLEICTTIMAGSTFDGTVLPGQAARIMTGAVMPAGTDTVVPQELTQSDGKRVQIAGAQTAGQHRRRSGEDLAKGKPALRAGRRIAPADLGLMASLGFAEIPVRRRVRVAFFSTGDELRSIGEALPPGHVYDSNRYTIFGMLSRLGVEMIDMGVIPDDPDALEQAVATAASSADAIISSGGVSVGEADFTKQIMNKLGDVRFWTIAMRPGRPMAFGKINDAYYFGLPGNPVAVMVTFYFFARLALFRLMGANRPTDALLRARCLSPFRKRPGRTEYQRATLSLAQDGQMQVKATGAQGSGVLRSMSEANCMVVLAHDQGPVDSGDFVQCLPFDGLTY